MSFPDLIGNPGFLQLKYERHEFIKKFIRKTISVIDPKIPIKLSFRQVVSRNPVPCEKALDSGSSPE